MSTNQQVAAQRWSAEDVVVALKQLFFYKRAAGHLLAGWLVKAPGMELKHALAQHCYHDVDHAVQLRGRLRALERLGDRLHTVPSAWRAFMHEIDSSASVDGVIADLHLVVRPRLVELARVVLACTDPLLDAATVRLLERLVLEEERHIEWAARSAETAPARSLAHDLSERFSAVLRVDCDPIPLDDALWPPIDRVAEAHRSPELRRGEAGAMKLIPADPWSSPADIGVFLHTSICEEFTTMELVARNSYEHPDMPLAFHLDMTRQAADEARHGAALMALLPSYGTAYGDHPVYTGSYDVLYQYDDCEPGSRRELLWRILLRQTFHEGMALDSLAREVKQREHLNQTTLAELHGFLLADEVLHVESGLKWSRFLCDGVAAKAMEERAHAHEALKRSLGRRRSSFVDRYPERALAEIASLAEKQISFDKPQHFGKQINRDARLVAGFLDEEIRQVIAWGYVAE